MWNIPVKGRYHGHGGMRAGKSARLVIRLDGWPASAYSSLLGNRRGGGTMDNRRDHGGPVAIIGVACRFPGAAEPAEFHDLTVAGRRMFRPVADGLQAALLDDWARPEAGTQDTGPVQKLAAETTALALADAGFRERRPGCGPPTRAGRFGLFLASSVAGVGGLVREQFGFAADVAPPGPAATSSLHAVAAAAAALGTGDLDLAVAGGAELGLDPAWLTAQARAGTLGRDEMRVYAADPAGLLPGEGCGMVVLARSADARAAGLPVYAEIAGWSTVPASPPALDGQALLAGLPAGRGRPHGHPAHRGRGHRDRGRGPGRADRVRAAAGGAGGPPRRSARWRPGSGTPGPRRASPAWSRPRWPWRPA